MITNVFLVVLCVLNFCNGANILAVIPIPSYSHQVAFRKLWEELSLRGHNVTVATTDPSKKIELVNMTEIDMSSSYEIWNEKYRFSKQAQKGLESWNVWEYFLYLVSEAVEDQLSLPEIQALIHKRDQYKFDVVMVEVFHPEYLIFGKLYNCPTILMGTIGSNAGMYRSLGNIDHPVLNPDLNISFAGKLNFFERILSTLYHWHHIYFEYFKCYPRKQQIIDKFFSKFPTVTVEELIRDNDVLLINESPLFKGIRALGPTTVNVGGANNLKPLKYLPKVNFTS